VPARLGVGRVALIIFALNLPFGYWRGRTRKFTLPWFLAIHLPVPLAIGLRILVGVGFRLATLPVFVGAFVAGQLAGARLRRMRSDRPRRLPGHPAD
jgi:hypothetical protein